MARRKSRAPDPAGVALASAAAERGAAVRPHPRAARLLRPAALLTAVVYLVLMPAYLLTHGGWPTPDYLVPPLLLVAIALGRGWPFVFDWGPFLVLILSWQATAGVANQFGRPVHVSGPVDAERWLFRGELPTLLLQERMFDPSQAHWYDWAATIQHAAHFVLPVAVGLLIWLRSRRTYWRYLASLMLVFYLGFAGYVLYPAAPPWMAGLRDVIPPVHRVAVETVLRLPSSAPIGLAYTHFSANQVAAIPSLHAATPLLLALVMIQLWGWRAVPALLYPLTMGFNLVYLGEHYAVDVLAGYAVAVVGYLCVWVAPAVWPRRWAMPSLQIERGLQLPGVVRAAGAAALPVLAVASIALIGSTLRPGQAPETGPVVPGLAVQSGSSGAITPVPCDQGSSTALTAGDFLLQVTGRYAVYLFDVESGECYALSANVSFPPPREDRAAVLAARAPVRMAPLPRVRAGVEYFALRIGTPAAALADAGLPPDRRYLLVVELADVPDVEAAALAVDDLAALVIIAEPPPGEPAPGAPPPEAEPAPVEPPAPVLPGTEPVPGEAPAPSREPVPGMAPSPGVEPIPSVGPAPSGDVPDEAPPSPDQP